MADEQTKPMLKYREADNGNCRVYYTANKRLYCWQNDGPRDGFKLYACSRDGEPSHEVRQDAFSGTEPPAGDEAIEQELRAFLDTPTPTMK